MSAVTMRYYYIGSSTDGTSLLESWNDIKKNVSTNEVSGLVFPNKMNWQNVRLIFVSFQKKGSNCMRESTVETIMTAGGNREETSQRTIIASQLLTELEDSPNSGRSNENKNQRKVSRPIDVTATAFTITNHIPLSSLPLQQERLRVHNWMMPRKQQSCLVKYSLLPKNPTRHTRAGGKLVAN